MKYFVRTFDIFGNSVSWNVNGDSMTKTILGCILSFMLVGLLIYISWVEGKDMVYKLNPTVNIEEIAFTNRPFITLNSTNFPIAVTCQDYSQINYLDPRYFVLEAYHYRVFNANSTSIPTYLLLEKCNEMHFPSFSEDYIKKSGMLNYMCISNQNITIGGYWDDLEIQYLAFTVKLCTDSNSNSDCAPINEITDIISNNLSPITLAIYVKDSIINTQNYTNPLSSFMLSLYKNIHLGVYKMYSVNIRNDDLLSDSDILLKNEYLDSSIKFDSSEYDDSSASIDSILVEIDLFVSNHKIRYSRRYKKILDIFANIGGLTKFFYLVGYVSAYYFSNMKLNIRLLNQIYDYNLETLLRQDHDISQPSNKNRVQSSPISHKRTCKLIGNLSSDTCKLRFMPKDFIYLIPCMANHCTMETKMKWKLYFNTKNDLSHSLDVAHILHKLKQVQKLTQLILSAEQYSVFQFVTRDLQAINIDFNTPHKYESEDIKLIQSFFNSKVESISQISYIDQKLAKLLKEKIKLKVLTTI